MFDNLLTAILFQLVNVIFVYLPIGYPRYAASVFASNGEGYCHNEYTYG